MNVSWMQRAFGIAFGVFAQLLFLPTVWSLYWFLKGPDGCIEQDGLWIDAILALQFAIPHSALLLPQVRKILNRWIPSALYGSFFCIATCLNLLVTILGWHTSTKTAWQFVGWQDQFIQCLFVG